MPHETSQAMGDTRDSVPALLALQRFARRVFRQAGLSVLSLVLVIGLATHSAVTHDVPREMPADVSRTVVQVQPASTTLTTASQNKMLHDEHTPQIRRPVRMLRSSVLYHHLTGARLSTVAIERSKTIEIAEATEAIKAQ